MEAINRKDKCTCIHMQIYTSMEHYLYSSIDVPKGSSERSHALLTLKSIVKYPASNHFFMSAELNGPNDRHKFMYNMFRRYMPLYTDLIHTNRHV